MKSSKETLQYLDLFKRDLNKCLSNSGSGHDVWKLVYKEQIHILELVEKYIKDKKEKVCVK